MDIQGTIEGRPGQIAFDRVERENREAYVQSLSGAQEWLKARSIPFRILGSLAVNSYVDPRGGTMNFNRPGSISQIQKVPDVDLLVPREYLPQVVEYSKQLLEGDHPIFLEMVYPTRYIDFRPGEDTSYITYKDIHFPVPSALFEEQNRDIIGTNITTIDPQTLFHLFVTNGGILRHKDWKKVLALGRYIRTEGESKFHENDFAPFHEFIKQRNIKYPFYRKGRLLMQRFGDKVPPLLQRSINHYGIPMMDKLLKPKS